MIAAIPNCRTSVANALEALIVVERRGGAESGAGLDAILEAQASSWSRGPVTLEQLSAARRARRRFGNGNHSAAVPRQSR